MSALVRLRRETAEMHQRVEETPFARAMADGSVERRRYVDYLRATAIMLDTLRTQVQRHGTARARSACARLDELSERLAADLELLAPNTPLTNAAAREAALAFADYIRCRVADGSACLLGVAYVIVGSHRGGRSIAAKVEAALGLDAGAGVRNIGATVNEGSGPWREFTDFLERELSTPAAMDEAVEGARDLLAVRGDLRGGRVRRAGGRARERDQPGSRRSSDRPGSRAPRAGDRRHGSGDGDVSLPELSLRRPWPTLRTQRQRLAADLARLRRTDRRAPDQRGPERGVPSICLEVRPTTICP